MGTRWVVFVAAVLVVGCGSLIPSREGRCDLRPARDQCTDLRDFKGPTLITFRGVCETLRAALDGGSYTEDARCEATGAIGGCQSSSVDGSKQTNWYYSGSKYQTEADARAECESAMRFVTP